MKDFPISFSMMLTPTVPSFLLLFFLTLWFNIPVFSQFHPSAAFEVQSTTQGFLLPRMTQSELNAINDPAEGLMVICTDCGDSRGVYTFNSDDEGWTRSATANDSFYTADGGMTNSRTVSLSTHKLTFKSNDNRVALAIDGQSQRVGIGTATPSSTLDVVGDARITGKLKDSAGDTGTDGQILSSKADGTTDWIPPVNIKVVNEATFNKDRFVKREGESYLNTADNKLYIAGGGRWIVFTGSDGGAAPPSDFTYQAPQDTRARTYGHVKSSVTGRFWLDRNLGASSAPSSISDTGSDFGRLYSWSDATTGNDVCPPGYRLPTRDELRAELPGFNDATGAFNVLKLTMMGFNTSGSSASASHNEGREGYYWSSGEFNLNGVVRGVGLYFDSGSNSANTFSYIKSLGFSVRCIMD